MLHDKLCDFVARISEPLVYNIFLGSVLNTINGLIYLTGMAKPVKSGNY